MPTGETKCHILEIFSWDNCISEPEYCEALFPYKAIAQDELTLVPGQIIKIIDKKLEDAGWWKGSLDGRVGVFPDNFVKIVKNPVKSRAVLPSVQGHGVTGGTGVKQVLKQAILKQTLETCDFQFYNITGLCWGEIWFKLFEEGIEFEVF